MAGSKERREGRMEGRLDGRQAGEGDHGSRRG